MSAGGPGQKNRSKKIEERQEKDRKGDFAHSHYHPKYSLFSDIQKAVKRRLLIEVLVKSAKMIASKKCC